MPSVRDVGASAEWAEGRRQGAGSTAAVGSRREPRDPGRAHSSHVWEMLLSPGEAVVMSRRGQMSG